MSPISVMDEWVSSVSTQLADISVNGFFVSASAARTPGLRLDTPTPPGLMLAIRDVGQAASTFVVDVRSGMVPDDIEIFPDRRLAALVFQSDENLLSSSVAVHGRPYGGAISIQVGKGLSVLPELSLIEGEFEVNPLHAPDGLRLEDARLKSESGGEYELITADGTCSLPSGTGVGRLRIFPRSDLTIPGIPILKVESATDSPLEFSFGGTLSTALPRGSTVVLLRKALLAIRTEDAVRDIEVRGNGTVRVQGALTDTHFVPDDGAALVLEVVGAAEGISGEVWLDAHDGGVLIGADDNPVRIRRIVKSGRAEIENVSLYSLDSLAVLPELKNVARLSVWLGPRAQRRELADNMTLGGGRAKTVAHKRAHFWATLADVLKEGHATGRVQSAARYNAFRLRRRHLERGAEKALLTAYSCVGYGESIKLPLIWIMVLCVLFTPALAQPPLHFGGGCCPRIDELGETFFALLLSPLAFFKSPIKPPGHVSGPVETFLLVGFQIISLMMLFFVLSAIRRLVKAE